MKSILVVAAHPDDEVLGMGGTIARHVADGDKVNVLFMSEGVSSRSVPGETRDWTKEIAEREVAACKAAKTLGITETIFLRLPNLRMRDQPMLDIVKQVENVLANFLPSTIYTHHAGDLNSDHRVTHEAVITACRPIQGCSVKEIISFEIPSSTEWSTGSIGGVFYPNLFVNISEYLEVKLAAINCYDFEMRPFPHPRSQKALRAMAERYGATVGNQAAEAFTILRKIID